MNINPGIPKYRESFRQLKAFSKAESAIVEIFRDDPQLKRYYGANTMKAFERKARDLRNL